MKIKVLACACVFALMAAGCKTMPQSPVTRPAKVEQKADKKAKAPQVKETKSEIPAQIKEQSPAQDFVKEFVLPVYLCEVPNINDYTLFANGGWDGNWYVGFNVCWMEKLPSLPEGKWYKVYVGAKLGRMKTRPVQGKPVWEKEAIPGEIYIAVSSTPAWKSSQSYFLIDTRDIPLEGDAENALEGVGESRWFWREVPMGAVNFKGDNYLALWSTAQEFQSTATSPILAGGWGTQKVNTWMNNDIKGCAPLDPDTSLKTAITAFEPAIAIKLVPQGVDRDITIKVVDVKEGRAKTSDKIINTVIYGEDIDRAWMEYYSMDDMAWKKTGNYVFNAPWIFTLKAKNLPEGQTEIRIVAGDIWENRGYSESIELNVKR